MDLLLGEKVEALVVTLAVKHNLCELLYAYEKFVALELLQADLDASYFYFVFRTSESLDGHPDNRS